MNNISEDLFNKLRSRFNDITIGDENGTVTNEPKEARFFDFSYSNNGTKIGKVSVSISEEEGLKVIYSKDIIENQDDISKKNWFDFLKELRVFSKKRMLDFSIRDINKTNLTKRDYNFLANRSGDDTMTESKLYGTSRVSYQKVGEARIVIKHTENINQESATSRTQKIGKIYIESAEGERFKYPYKHLSGARAMAMHVSEGGNAYDDFGKHIVGLSEEMAKLRKFKNYMGRSAVMAESLAGYTDIVKERIATVKKEIASLQKPAYYKEAFETFNPPVLEDVPNDVAENWIDELTIRQFNEELQDIFPYIYNLVKEGTKAKELGPDDLLGESDEQLDEILPALAVPVLLTAARAAIPALTRIGASILAKRGAAAAAAGQVARGAGQVAKGAGNFAVKNPIKTTVAGVAAANPDATMNVINTGKDIAQGVGDTVDAVQGAAQTAQDTMTGLATTAQEVMDKASQGIDGIQGEISAFLGGGALKQIASAASKYALPVLAVIALLYGGKKVIDWLMGKSKEPRTEDIDIDEGLKGAGIGAGIGAVAGPAIAAMAGGNPAVGKLGQAALGAALGAPSGALIGAINKDEKRKKAKLAKAKKDKEDKKDKKTKEEFELEQAFEDIMGQFADSVCEECGNPSWRTLDEEKQKGVDGKVCWKGYKRMGTKMKGGKRVDNCVKVGEDDTEEGNAYAHAVRKAKMDGKKKGDKVQGPDGDEITIEKDEKTPLGEFILSYYDRESGEFPKGETAVLTMVEKDYGEQFIEPAKAFIEQVQALYDDYQMRTQPQQMEVDTEFDRMKELAGLR